MEEKLLHQLEKLLGTLERMRLDEYVEHISSRRRLIWENLLYGMVRGFIGGEIPAWLDQPIAAGIAAIASLDPSADH